MQEILDVLHGMFDSEGQLSFCVKDKWRVKQFGELNALEGNVGCGAPSNPADEIQRQKHSWRMYLHTPAQQ